MNHCIRTRTASTPGHPGHSSRFSGLIVGLAFLACAPQAGAQCNPDQTPPPGLPIGPGDQVLCYGDSVTKGFDSRPMHYAKIMERLLRDAYCALETVTFDGRGSNSGHWKAYRRRLARILENNDYSAVTIQDAGKAKRRKDDRFRGYIEATLLGAAAAKPGVELLATTTAGLDVPRAGKKWTRSYAKSENFSAHNGDVVLAVDTVGVPLADWAAEACGAYEARPDLAWTVDGVHLDTWGELLYALANLEAWGVPREDLDPTRLAEVWPDLDAETSTAAADIVYSTPEHCQTLAPPPASEVP